MTVDTQQLFDLKQKVKKLDELRIRAEAAHEQAIARLKELGYDTVEEAEDALKEMTHTLADEEASLAEDVDALLDKYPGLR